MYHVIVEGIKGIDRHYLHKKKPYKQFLKQLNENMKPSVRIISEKCNGQYQSCGRFLSKNFSM